MFHRYVLPAVGTKSVDFDRARLLMDRALLRQTIREMNKAGAHGAQWVWERYCDLHLIKYGAAFVPDINPEWDT